MPPAKVSARPDAMVLRPTRLFDGSAHTVVESPVVVVVGATIVAVGDRTVQPREATVVDFPGATLLPGLIDPHVHLAFDGSPDPVAALADRDADAVLAAMRVAARTALRGGITTVRDLGDRDYLSLVLRGEPDLPTIVASGPPITTVNGHCHFLGGGIGNSVGNVRSAVRAHVDRGVDVVKVMASGGTMTPGTAQERSQFDSEVLSAVVDEAHRNGLPVTAHAHGMGAIADAVAAGVDGLEHVSFWSAKGVDKPDDHLVKQIVDRQLPLGATAGLLGVPGLSPPASVLERTPSITENFRHLYASGAQVIAGTDAGVGPHKPHNVLPYASERLAAFGMAPGAILESMTSTAAEVCGLGHRKGRIAPGYDADFLVVTGDPIANPLDLHRIRAVYARGFPVDLS